MRIAPNKPGAAWSKLLAVIALAIALPVLDGCGCGFDCNSGNNNKGPAFLDLGFSDEDLEELKQVVIEVDKITLTRSGGENVVIDTFSIDELGAVNADSFQIDLLQYRGLNQLLVVTDLELDSQTYSALEIEIIDGDLNSSYVQESDDSLKQLNISGSSLSLPGMSLSTGNEAYTVTFGLARALQYRSSTGDYLLTTTGIRVQDNAVDASITGRVDSALFDEAAPCDAKTDPESENRIYLYSSTGMMQGQAGDVFTSNSSNEIPEETVAPFAVATLAEDTLTGTWQYALGFLPAGDYTLAFSCDAADDDPVDYDSITVPLPDNQAYELSLEEGGQEVCDLGLEGSC
jgi:hypothetical protein